MSKLVVIIGITGNQGGSVANAFLQDPEWRVRGLSRNLDSEQSKSLIGRGVEMVKVELHDPQSLQNVFKGANLVFSVTDFWEPFLDPAKNALAKEQGKLNGQLAYELELEQGKNIADAVAREVEGLDEVGFVASTLCNAKKSSNGKYTQLWHFDSKAEAFPEYVDEKYPELARKTSYLHTGYFFTSWRYLPGRWFAKQADDSIQMQFPTSPDTVVPHLDPAKDTGPWVKALLKLPPGSTLMAASEWLTWPQWIAIFGEVTGAKTSYKQTSKDDLGKHIPGEVGKEIGDMFEFSSDFAYNAFQLDTFKTWDLEKMGIEVPTTTLRSYIEQEDWVSAGILPAWTLQGSRGEENGDTDVERVAIRGSS